MSQKQRRRQRRRLGILVIVFLLSGQGYREVEKPPESNDVATPQPKHIALQSRWKSTHNAQDARAYVTEVVTSGRAVRLLPTVVKTYKVDATSFQLDHEVLNSADVPWNMVAEFLDRALKDAH